MVSHGTDFPTMFSCTATPNGGRGYCLHTSYASAKLPSCEEFLGLVHSSAPRLHTINVARLSKASTIRTNTLGGRVSAHHGAVIHRAAGWRSFLRV
jgi:hypothetical protein